MAKELIVNEYVDRRAELHNQWLVESDHLWRTQRLRLAYPPIPPYPTELDVVNRAQRLMMFLLENKVPVDDTPQEQIKPAESTVDISEPVIEPTIEETVEPTVSDAVENRPTKIPDKILEYSAIKVASELEQGQPASSKIMTNILGKIKDITGKKES